MKSLGKDTSVCRCLAALCRVEGGRCEKIFFISYRYRNTKLYCTCVPNHIPYTRMSLCDVGHSHAQDFERMQINGDFFVSSSSTDYGQRVTEKDLLVASCN